MDAYAALASDIDDQGDACDALASSGPFWKVYRKEDAIYNSIATADDSFLSESRKATTSGRYFEETDGKLTFVRERL